MTDEFEPTWQALVENGTSKRNKDATKRFWDTLTPEQQHIAFVNITRKWRENGFLQYDPIRAIKENIRRHQFVGPTNYNGLRLKAGVRYVIAKYHGSYGTYSLDEAREFGMEIKQEISTISR